MQKILVGAHALQGRPGFPLHIGAVPFRPAPSSPVRPLLGTNRAFFPLTLLPRASNSRNEDSRPLNHQQESKEPAHQPPARLPFLDSLEKTVGQLVLWLTLGLGLLGCLFFVVRNSMQNPSSGAVACHDLSHPYSHCTFMLLY
jgi:hypothetical protein